MKRRSSQPHQNLHSARIEKKYKNSKEAKRRRKQEEAQGVENWRTATADTDARHKARKHG